MYTLFVPQPEIFLVGHLGPQYPKIPLELIFDLFEGPGAIFQKKYLKQQFQSLILPDQFSRPPMELGG